MLKTIIVIIVIIVFTSCVNLVPGWNTWTGEQEHEEREED